MGARVRVGRGKKCSIRRREDAFYTCLRTIVSAGGLLRAPVF